MQIALTNKFASISELKKNPSRLIQDAGTQAIAILNHNITAAYLVPVKTFERLMDMIDDNDLRTIVTERLSDNHLPIKVDINAL